MKRNVLVCIVLTLAGSMIAAESGPKDDVAEAAKKLADAGNYAWKTTVEFGNFTGETEGKTDKEGMVSLSMSFGDNTTEAFLKNGKGAVKAADLAIAQDRRGRACPDHPIAETKLVEQGDHPPIG